MKVYTQVLMWNVVQWRKVELISQTSFKSMRDPRDPRLIRPSLVLFFIRLLSLSWGDSVWYTQTTSECLCLSAFLHLHTKPSLSSYIKKKKNSSARKETNQKRGFERLMQHRRLLSSTLCFTKLTNPRSNKTHGFCQAKYAEYTWHSLKYYWENSTLGHFRTDNPYFDYPNLTICTSTLHTC